MVRDLDAPGKEFVYGKQYSYGEAVRLISHIEKIPDILTQLTFGLTEYQLQKSCRPNGRTALQLINYISDQILHGYLHSKLILSETSGTIKEACGIPDNVYQSDNYREIEQTVELCFLTISRWAYLLRSIKEDSFKKAVRLPSICNAETLAEFIAYYDWCIYTNLTQLELISKGFVI